MKMVYTLLLALSCGSLLAQQPDRKQLHETAKNYMRQGDFNNALLILIRLQQQDPDNLEIQKDLAFTYYLKKDLVKALETAKPFSDRKDADVQAFQILGMVYKALEQRKEAEKMYKAALKKFPSSGVLYNEYGEMLWAKENFSEATRQWEKGIESDPNYAGNYYNASKYYYFSSDKVWGLLYGEIFVNLESYTKRTSEIKKLLFDGYKKLFADNDIHKNQTGNNEFVTVFLDGMNKQSSATNGGITPQSLLALRTKFILDWNNSYASRFPYRLFDHYTQLQKMGLFEAYNQWLFGEIADPKAYGDWKTAHPTEQAEFLRLQQNRVFKIPAGQYYKSSSK